MFDQSSPNGILLFREASKVLVAYGSRVLQHPYRTDVYKARVCKVWGALRVGSGRVDAYELSYPPDEHEQPKRRALH